MSLEERKEPISRFGMKLEKMPNANAMKDKYRIIFFEFSIIVFRDLIKLYPRKDCVARKTKMMCHQLNGLGL